MGSFEVEFRRRWRKRSAVFVWKGPATDAAKALGFALSAFDLAWDAMAAANGDRRTKPRSWHKIEPKVLEVSPQTAESWRIGTPMLKACGGSQNRPVDASSLEAHRAVSDAIKSIARHEVATAETPFKPGHGVSIRITFFQTAMHDDVSVHVSKQAHEEDEWVGTLPRQAQRAVLAMVATYIALMGADCPASTWTKGYAAPMGATLAAAERATALDGPTAFLEPALAHMRAIGLGDHAEAVAEEAIRKKGSAC